MKNKICLVLGYIILLFAQNKLSGQNLSNYSGGNGYGAASFTYPIEGSVIQRNISDNANISFTGHIGYGYQDATKYNYAIIANELDPITGNPKSPLNVLSWGVTVSNVSADLGYFNKYVNMPKGWWSLSLIISRKDGTGGFGACNIKFGVGDSFIIAGQSNARGFPDNWDNNLIHYDNTITDNQLPDASRVLGYIEGTGGGNGTVQNGLPVFKPFEKLTLNKQLNIFDGVYKRPIYPQGMTSWFWTSLGKKYVESRNVPIQFFNTAIADTKISQWQKEADNPNTPEQEGDLYRRLYRNISIHSSILGNRAILWHQGERDANENTLENTYKLGLESLMNTVQNDYAPNGITWGKLNWYISEVSYYGADGNNNSLLRPTIISAQSNSTPSGTGPIKKKGIKTDNLDFTKRGPSQKLHFHAATHNVVANKWMNTTGEGTDNLWDNTPKIPQQGLFEINVSVSGGNYLIEPVAGNNDTSDPYQYYWVLNEQSPLDVSPQNYNNRTLTISTLRQPDRNYYTCFFKRQSWGYFLMCQPFIAPNNLDEQRQLKLRQAAIEINSLGFSSSTEQKNITVVSNNLAWDAVNKPSWVDLSTTVGGFGETQLSISTNSVNNTGSNRTATLRVKEYGTTNGYEKTLTITQSATSGCTQTNLSSLTPSSETFSYTGKRNNLNISRQTLMVGGYTTSNGVGVHANSRLVYDLNGQYSTFSGSVGRDDASDNCGCGTMKLQFVIKVVGETNALFTSSLLGTADGKQAFSVNVAGKNQIELIVNDGNDNTWGDHADWLDAILYCGTPPTCTTAPPVPTNVISSPQTINSGGSSNLSATCATGVVVWNTGQTANSITVSPTITTSYNAKCVSGSCPASNTVSVGVTVNSSGCSGFANGTVMGTWTVTGQPLVARFFHGQYWLTQRAGTSPDVFVVRGSGMLQRSDVSLSNGSYYNMVNCFAWTYSDYGSLQNPPSTTFPTPSGYSLSYSQDGTMIYTANSGGGSGSGCTDTYVSNNWASATIGDGSGPKIGQNYQGGTMNINGTAYSQGIGTHAGSEIVYNLGSHSYANFKASVGRDVSSYSCNCGGQTIVFKVYNHSTGALIGSSTNNPVTKTINQSASDMVVPISGVSSIRLVVEDGGDQIWGDWANWGKARFTCAGSNFREAPTPTEEWFWVSPNPNDGKFIAKVNLKMPQNVQLYLSDIKGNIIKEFTFVGVEGMNNFEINIQDKITIESIYNILCQAGEASDSKRVIVEK